MVAVTQLRHDRPFLTRIVRRAIILSFKRSQKDRALLSVLHDYLAWTTFDALRDGELAERLVPILAQVREDLERPREKWETAERWRRVRIFYTGYLSALETLLDVAHGRDFMADEPLPREEFDECWRLARRALEL